MCYTELPSMHDRWYCTHSSSAEIQNSHEDFWNWISNSGTMILHTAAPAYYTDHSIVTAVDTQNLVWDSGSHNSDSDCRSCHGIHVSYPSAICHSLGTDNGFLPVKKQEYSYSYSFTLRPCESTYQATFPGLWPHTQLVCEERNVGWVRDYMESKWGWVSYLFNCSDFSADCSFGPRGKGGLANIVHPHAMGYGKLSYWSISLDFSKCAK